MQTILVNTADWDPRQGSEAVPDGWLIANAPRPIAGRMTWTGPFRHGIFYAASPAIPGGTFGWEADDARLVEFIDDAEIERRCAVKAAEYYPDLAAAIADGITVEILAQSLQLPWRG
jgi:hypothetical protein